MKKSIALLAGVAAATLTFAPVHARASNNSASAPPPPAAASDPRVDELSQRVDALEQELQESEMRQAADHEKVDSWKPLSGWWDDTSISGRMYYDIASIENKNNGSRGKNNNGVGFDIKRFYVGIDHKFDEIFSANITTDFLYDSPTGTTNAVDATGNPATLTVSGSNATQIYIKKAYLQAKLSDAFIIRLGSADLPWIPYVEDVYGYRYVENTLIDRVKFGTSADWGVHVLGKLYDGLIAYQFSAINGGGYKKPGFIGMVNHTKRIDFEGRVSLNYQGFQLAVGGYDGALGVTGATLTNHTATRVDALGAYTGKLADHNVRLGFEYFTASNFTQVTSPTSSHGWGYGPFASIEIVPEWALFGRFDHVKPYSDAARNTFTNDYYNVGVSWSPAKIVDFALVYKHDAGYAGVFSDQNGTIGGTAFAPGNGGADNEIGLWGQFRW